MQLREWAVGVVNEEEQILREQYQQEADEERVARRNAAVMGNFDLVLGSLDG